jgi:hypothetical protein
MGAKHKNISKASDKISPPIEKASFPLNKTLYFVTRV